MLGALLRAIAVPPTVADVDGVNFANALAAFDPAHQAPHLPGYPVYVLLAKVAALFTASETVALAFFAVALWPIAAALLYLGTAVHLGKRAGLGAAFAASLAPGAVLAGGWPASDGLGLAMLCISAGVLGLALARASAKLEALAGALLGLTLGVRLSFWPVVLSLLVLALQHNGKARSFLRELTQSVRSRSETRKKEAVRRARTDDRAKIARPRAIVMAQMLLVFPMGWAFIAANAAWIGVLMWKLGARGLFSGYAGFASGHFTSFGHTEGAIGARALTASRVFFTAGLGADELVVVLLIAAAAIFARRDRKLLRIAALLAAPYALWILFGQNVDKARHMLPLIPIAGALLFTAHRALAAALAIAWCAVAIDRAQDQGSTTAPRAAIVDALRREHGPERLQIFAGEEARVFEHLAPEYRVWRVDRADVLEEGASWASAHGAEVWITSDAAGVERLRPQLTMIAEASARESIRGPDAHLALYRYEARSETRSEARAQ